MRETIEDNEEIIVSSGLLVADNDRLVAVASSWHQKDAGVSVGGVICIPKCCIVKRRIVR